MRYRGPIHRNRVGRWCLKAGGEEKDQLFNGYRVSETQDESVLEICLTTLNILNSTEPHLTMVKKVNFMLCIFTTIKRK